MRGIKSLIVIASVAFIAGCGGGGGGSYGSADVILDNSADAYTGDSGSYVTICNNSYDYYIVDVRSNPVSAGSDGPNRLTSGDIAPGDCKSLYTSNCDTDYFLDIYYEGGASYSLTYSRDCGYDYTFDFYY